MVWIWLIAIVVVLLALGAWADWSRRRRGLRGAIDTTHNPRETTALGEPGAHDPIYGAKPDDGDDR